MNSLTMGFFYVSGLAWALTECGVMASNGNWTPLILYVIGFTLMFSILGCVPISDRAVEISGAVFAVLLAIGLVLITMYTFSTGATTIALVKGVFAAGFCITGFVSMTSALKPSGSH